MSSQFVHSRSRQASIGRGRAGSAGVGLPGRALSQMSPEQVFEMELLAEQPIQRPVGQQAFEPAAAAPLSRLRRIGNGFQAVRSAIGSGLKTAGSAIGSGLETAGSAVVSAGRSVGNGFQTAGSAIGSGLKTAGSAIASAGRSVGTALGISGNEYEKQFARDRLKGIGNSIVSKAALGFSLAAKGVAYTVMAGVAVGAAAAIGVAAAGVAVGVGAVAAIRGGYRWHKASKTIDKLEKLSANLPETQYAIAQLQKRINRSQRQIVGGVIGAVAGAVTLGIGAATAGVGAAAIGLGIAGGVGAAIGVHAFGETIAGNTESGQKKVNGWRESKLGKSKLGKYLLGAKKEGNQGELRNQSAENIVAGIQREKTAYKELAAALDLHINSGDMFDEKKRKAAVILVANALKST